MFEWLPLVYKVYGGDSSQHWGAHVDELIIFYAVLIGTIEGKYLGLQKVAIQTGIPKSTCRRKLEVMLERGIVEKNARGKYMASVALANSQKAVGAVLLICHMVEEAGEKLSKMEPLVKDG